MRVLAEQVVARCRELAQFTEEPGRITRTFLSPPMHGVHGLVGQWMHEAGLAVEIDSVGNIRGTRGTARLLVGSHLDTVPNAGAFDGILGVILGVALARITTGPLAVIGFSEEEGVRFGVPFIGSRALAGTVKPLLDADPRINEAIRVYGLDASKNSEAGLAVKAYLEIHIEQGPVLEHVKLPLGIVDAIVGQTRYAVTFRGSANHAGTTPMDLRRDALTSAAEWILAAERIGMQTDGLVATVGRCDVSPGAANVIPGLVQATVDVRHKDDAVRSVAADRLLKAAREVATRRKVGVEMDELMNIPTTLMDAELTAALAQAAADVGLPVYHMTSGAGHDAMVMAQVMPAAMLFVRSPGGISHHPDESVLIEDVDAALRCGKRFVERWHG